MKKKEKKIKLKYTKKVFLRKKGRTEIKCLKKLYVKKKEIKRNKVNISIYHVHRHDDESCRRLYQRFH